MGSGFWDIEESDLPCQDPDHPFSEGPSLNRHDRRRGHGQITPKVPRTGGPIARDRGAKLILAQGLRGDDDDVPGI